NWLDRVPMRRKQSTQLLDGVPVRARRTTNKDRLAYRENVAAIQRPRGLNALTGANSGNGSLHFRDFRTPRRRPGASDDRDLIQNQGDVLDEYRIGHLRCGRQALYYTSQLLEYVLVLEVLGSCFLNVDRHARDVRELAPVDRWSDLPCQHHVGHVW